MLNGIFGGAGLWGTGLCSQAQMNLRAQQADQDFAMAMAQQQRSMQQWGGMIHVPPGTAKNMRNIHTIAGRAYRCDYCDRLTVKPDRENGCRGCGASEWR